MASRAGAGYQPLPQQQQEEGEEAYEMRDPAHGEDPKAPDDDDDAAAPLDERDLAAHVVSLADDPSLNPWTLRAFVLGAALSVFGGVLAEIYYFKPQTVYVSTMFLAMIAYVLGTFMAAVIPSRGLLRHLNPGPFNKKENTFVVIMASATANSALGTEVLAVQRLYYNTTLDPVTSVFLLFSSQLLGYGIGGLLRNVLLYPSKMLYPTVLPLTSMLDVLFSKGISNRKQLKLFYIAFAAVFVWEIFPEWMFPLLTGISIFCLASPHSAHTTRIFGGSNGNEGLGLFSVCLDWQYISGNANPFAIPLRAQLSNLIGYTLCVVVLLGVYYTDTWEAKSFPFLSQTLFYRNGSLYNQTLILDERLEVDPARLEEQGLPYYSAAWVIHLLAINLGLAATITHVLLWNFDDVKGAWAWVRPAAFRDVQWAFWRDDGQREVPDNPGMDPHYRAMLKYPDAPNSWYLLLLLVSLASALVLIHTTKSTLPWWGLATACALGAGAVVFFGALYALTGLAFAVQPFVQMVGGFLLPGRPVANMFFVLFSFNSVNQAQLLLRDLKIGQYTKLPPRVSFTAQILGTLIGSVLNYILMNSIIDNQRPILLSVAGTNIWSGQHPQKYNSQAIVWGGLAHDLFAPGKRYQWVAYAYALGLLVPVPFWAAHKRWPHLRADYLYTPVICYYIGWLAVGINSSVLSYFAVAWASQWFLRTRYPRWFAKYNYVLAAALDGGTQVMVFVLSFAVQGAAGKARLFPQWWGANQNGNYDRCAVIPTLGQ